MRLENEGTEPPTRQPRKGTTRPAGPETGTETAPTSDEDDRPQSLLTVADEEAFEDMRVAQLLIDDPAGYEEMMIDHSLDRHRMRTQRRAQG